MQNYRVYIGNLSYYATTERIQDAFDFEGLVTTDVEIITDKATNKPRGYAFVGLKNEKDFKWALEKLAGAKIEGRPIIIRPATARVNKPKLMSTEKPIKSPIENTQKLNSDFLAYSK